MCRFFSVKAERRQLQCETFSVRRSLQLPQQTSFLFWSVFILRRCQILCLISLCIQLHLHHWDKEGIWQFPSKAQINLFLINVHLRRMIDRDQVIDKHSYAFTNTGTHWRTPHWWTELISVEKQCHPFKSLRCSVWVHMVWSLRTQPSTKTHRHTCHSECISTLFVQADSLLSLSCFGITTLTILLP